MDRPKCAEKAPDLDDDKGILKKLLAIELERLDTAVRIEKERSIVFPETSVIIRDIQKLEAEIKDRTRQKTPQRSNVYDYHE